jgi:hypothetical protein
VGRRFDGTGISGVKFTYFDPMRNALSLTTGLDPTGGFTTLFGGLVPYVQSYTGPQSPSTAVNTFYPNINKLALDSEALVLEDDGSGYIGDEYGGHVYYFDASKQIIGVIIPPQAFETCPHGHAVLRIPRHAGSPQDASIFAFHGQHVRTCSTGSRGCWRLETAASYSIAPGRMRLKCVDFRVDLAPASITSAPTRAPTATTMDADWRTFSRV